VVFSTNKTDRHDMTEILLKVALNTIKPKPFTCDKSFHQELNWSKFSLTKSLCKHASKTLMYFHGIETHPIFLKTLTAFDGN
jgi:hypothetical protein